MSNPAATQQYWLARHSFGEYTWVLAPVVLHEETDGHVTPAPHVGTDEYTVTLHVPQTDDFIIFSITTLELAKRRAQMLCPFETPLRWQHFPSREEAARYLRKSAHANPMLKMLRRGMMLCLPFTGVTDVPTGLAPKVAMQHGGPPPDWPATDSLDVWKRVVVTLEAVLQEHRHSRGANLYDDPRFRDSVIQYFKPIVGNSANRALKEHLDAAFGEHAPLLARWKQGLYAIRNQSAHPGSPRISTVGLSATLVLVRATIRAYYFGNTPIEEQTYPLGESDVTILVVACSMENPGEAP